MIKSDVKIIPASLARTEEESKFQLERIVPLSSTVHLDYTDGNFVEGKTIDWQILYDLPEFYHDVEFELHLMTKNPLELAQEASLRGFTKVIVPIEEISSEDVTIVENISNDCEIYLSLNPSTSTELLEPFLPYISGVLLMGVEPGRQGQEFNPNILGKVAKLKDGKFEGKIEVDGGVNLATIDQIIKHSVDELVVGSALIKAESPREVYEKLIAKVGKDASKPI